MFVIHGLYEIFVYQYRSMAIYVVAAQQAQGKVLIFVETGSLVSPGWIEPILDILQTKKNTFVVPR